MSCARSPSQLSTRSAEMVDDRIVQTKMKKLSAFKIVIAFTLVCASCATAQTGDLTRLERTLAELQRQYAIPGMSAGIAQGDRVVWTRGFGLADQAKGVTVTSNTVFHLASLTKP